MLYYLEYLTRCNGIRECIVSARIFHAEGRAPVVQRCEPAPLLRKNCRIFTLGLGRATNSMHENILVIARLFLPEHRAEALSKRYPELGKQQTGALRRTSRSEATSGCCTADCIA
jgi:hypothetical protein